MVLYDPQLAELGAWRSSPPGQPSATDSYQLVDRHTFRQILMHGLGSRLHFDSALQTIEQTDNAVVARFANGSSAIADLVVGADGVGSATRRWLLPSAGVSTTSLLVYGRTPLGPDRFAAPAWVANRGMAIVGAPDGNRLTVGPFLKREPFAAATARWAPDLQLTEIPDYLFWAFQGPHTWLRRDADERVSLDPATLHARVRAVIATWHPDLPAVVEHADVEATFLTALHAAEPVAAWPTTRVTLLGDAIHAMTPLGGEGANTALRDAEVLTQQLLSAGAAGEPLLSAVGAYESAMLDYGFAAVARSLSTPLFRERFGLRNGA
jgi:2-polyprenyl-6-methoxyphenol hydroxylase-like FAD-dependent oxidoreductase